MQWYDASLLLTSGDKDVTQFYNIQNSKVRHCWNQKLGEVTVVCFPPPGSTDFSQRLHLADITCMNFKHPNILPIHGFTTWSKGFGVIVDTTCRSSVHDLLQTTLSFDLKLQLAYDLSSALTYLHSYNDSGGIVHGNVSSKILHLTYDLQLTLPCFHGLEKWFEKNVVQSTCKATDVHDFGLFLVELLTQKSSMTEVETLTNIIKGTKNHLKSSKRFNDLNILKCLEKIMWRCLSVSTNEGPDMPKVSGWLMNKLLNRNKANIVQEKAALLKGITYCKSATKNKIIPLQHFSYPFEEPDVVPMISLQQAETVHLRKRHERVVFMGGLYTANEVMEYDPLTDTLYRLPDLNYERWSCTAAFCSDCIYVFGGLANGKSSKYVECLNIAKKSDEWHVKNEMLLARHGTVAVHIAGLIYLPGGFIDSVDEENDLTSEIHYYNTTLDEWQQVGSLLTPRGHHSSVEWQENLYTLGGVTYGETRLESLECFNTTQKQSTYLQPMFTKRGLPGAAVVNNLIYAFGGQLQTFVDLDSAECYNPETNTWVRLQGKMNKFTKACGAAVASGKIFAIGGVGKNNAGKAIEIFDPETKRWKLHVKRLARDWINPGATTITRYTDSPTLF